MPFSYERAKRELLEERAELRDQLRRIDNNAEYEGVGYGNHMADDGTEAFEQTVGVAFRRKIAASLGDVERALAKFDNGTYGICESCGGRIDRARLEALPSAVYCLECQTQHEYGE
jgi:DnaK suppressor protein